jgi:acyl-CoA oxidase
VDRVLLEALRDGVEGASSAEIGDALGRLHALFALSTLERNRGWYLESGYFEGPKAKAIRTLVNTLCRELRPDAVALVDAFGIPDQVLRAPAGLRGH